MVKFCGNCGNVGTTRCKGCTTTAKPGVAPTHWQPEAVEKDISQKAKADDGKLEMDLVPTQIARDIAQVRMYGNKKYGSPDNWKQVELRRYKNALLRHTLAFTEDENSVDEESGIEHYKHMACNMAFICEMMKRRENMAEFNQLMERAKMFRQEVEALCDVRL